VVKQPVERLPFVISEREEGWVKANYPQLGFEGGRPPLRLVGSIDYCYAPSIPSSVVRKMFGDANCRITDSYDINISFDRRPPTYSMLPIIQEVGGRIELAARRHGITNLSDVHISTGGTLCLCVPPEAHLYFSAGFALEEYVSRLVVPFFYGQSFFERYGTWPWGTYSHGRLGVLESYATVGNDSSPQSLLELSGLIETVGESELSKRIETAVLKLTRPHMGGPCICGSGKRFRDCHPLVFQPLLKTWTMFQEQSQDQQRLSKIESEIG
jgi:hypothetical protein